MKLGFIGLGKMGARMVQKLLKEGHEVVVWNRSSEPIENLKSQISNLKSTSQNLKSAETIRELIGGLDKPRVIWSMVPAGEATDNVLTEISKFIEKDDIIIDGGNAFYKDTQERFEKFRKQGIRFLGIGVSGGIIAGTQGYPMMVGGDKSAYEAIKPILNSLAKPARHATQGVAGGPRGGYEYFGTGGAGHFVKMVHNGIEYGIMQSLGEGFEVLNKAPYELDLLKVAKLWQKGTLVSGFLLDRAVEVFAKDQTLKNIEGIIAESGEAKWTVETAKEEGVDVEIIARSLEFRRRSQKDKKIQNSFSAKLVAALRNAFGGHEIKKKQN